jgi:hypothetical protein
MACKKKLYKFRPDAPIPTVDTHATKNLRRPRPCDPAAIEAGVRQTLADRLSGNLLGLWLLVPEHLRLGTWDLLCGWTGRPGAFVEPRLALQLVHEAALCITGIRERRSLRQRGFELANGLPFLASDVAIHLLLNSHSVADAQQLQIALGKLRRASNHFQGRVLVIDPHRLRSYSKRQMRRHKKDAQARAVNVAQTFFALDADTRQPVAFLTGTSARTVSQATPELLQLAAEILAPSDTPSEQPTLVVADAEHFSATLLDRIHQDTRFDLLVPMPMTAYLQRQLQAIPAEQFTPHWAGYATAQLPYRLKNARQGPFHQFVQRMGERPDEYQFNAFLSTRAGDLVQALSAEYPKRWHIEEFFNTDQDLGWNRAGTLNLHIRTGHMTMSLIAQTVIHQLRQRLGEPASTWNCRGLADKLFTGLEGDVRVDEDTIVVTYYNAPNADRLKAVYAGLPARLAAENIDPRVPWLYDFKLDFRFR